jgi:hypothetical protein
MIAPSGDTTGATDRPVLQAAIDAGLCELEAGSTYYLDAPLQMRSGTVVCSSGAARWVLRQGSAWSLTGETRANALILADASDAGPTTTLVTTSPVGEETIAVASSAGFTIGDCWRVGETIPPGTGAYGMSWGSDVQTHAVGVIAAIAGTTWTHGLEQAHHLGAGMTLRKLAGVVREVSITGGRIDAWDPTLTLPRVASAIAASYAIDWTLDIEVAGFCGWAIDTIGCAAWRGRIVDLGANSGVRRRWCAAAWRVEVVTELLYRVRSHPQASYPLPKIHDRDDVRACVDVLDIAHCETAAWLWGHYGCTTTLRARDVHGERILTTGSPPTGEQMGGQQGLALSTGANAITLAVMGLDNDWHVDVSDCHSGAAWKYAVDPDERPRWASAVYWHDDIGSTMAGRIVNRSVFGDGPPYGSASRYARVGLRIHDVRGRAELNVQGYPTAVVSGGTFAAVAGNLVADGQPGSGLGYGYAACVSIAVEPPIWDSVEIRNHTVPMADDPGQSALAIPAYARPFARRMLWNGVEIGPVHWVRIPDGTYGTVGRGYAFDATAPAGTRRVVGTSPTKLPGVVLLTQASYDPRQCLCTLAPGGVGTITSGGAIAVGDRLELNSAGKAVPVTNGRVIGVAQSRATAADQSVTYGGA